jgi:hypothetical protein
VDDNERATLPATIGELRRRLEQHGQPWTVPDRFNDDDPLPNPPRGGQPVDPGNVQGLRALDTQEEFEAYLREVHPSNPYLCYALARSEHYRVRVRQFRWGTDSWP